MAAASPFLNASGSHKVKRICAQQKTDLEQKRLQSYETVGFNLLDSFHVTRAAESFRTAWGAESHNDNKCSIVCKKFGVLSSKM